MANANQDANLIALPVVPYPDCGRVVVTYVACRGQFAGERFPSRWQPGRGGMRFLQVAGSLRKVPGFAGPEDTSVGAN